MGMKNVALKALMVAVLFAGGSFSMSKSVKIMSWPQDPNGCSIC